MPRLTGIFNAFTTVDQIPPEDMARWLKPNPGLANIENYISNKILYPQTIPVTQSDLAIELAMLREVARRQPELFTVKGNIRIPEELSERMGTLLDLTLALVDALSPKEKVAILLGNKAVGFASINGKTLDIELSGQVYQIKR